MAALDFPTSPTPGQLYPASPAAGVPQYTWDGEKWITGSVGSGMYVLKTGDTMTGALVLPGNATSALQAVPKQQLDALTAAQFQALAANGMQINGGFEVSQERGTVGTSSPGTYPVDGWLLAYLNTVQAGAAHAMSPTKFPGYPAHLFVNTLIALPTQAAGDYTRISQSIEGYRCARLAWGTANAMPITLAFWTAHHRPGVYSVTVFNRPVDRTYATTYTQAAADVPQYNVITIPGDTTGTWETGNLAGITINFAIACGTTGIAPSTNNWLAGGYLAAPGQVNGVATTSDVSYFTGVTVLPGTHTITAAQSSLLMRPYDVELALCQRYYRRFGGETLADLLLQGYGSPSLAKTMSLSPSMRAAPAIAQFGTFAQGGVSTQSLWSSRTTFTWQINGPGGQMYSQAMGDGGFSFDARL